MFAALNSMEPAVAGLSEMDLLQKGQEWARLRRPAMVDFVKMRLTSLSDWLGDRDYLEERFTAGDLLMTTVLRLLRHTELVAQMPRLEAYRVRCEARPAFAKALAAQMATFERHSPPK